jgi:CheY-like chemotaxis protein
MTSDGPSEYNLAAHSPPGEFIHQVHDLYQHLGDLVYLRAHPLLDVLIPGASLPRKERAWQLQDLLLNTIKELDPGPQAPVLSPRWRRYRLMLRRYKNGIDAETVMQELAISRRQFYRDHEAALAAIAGVLWDHAATQPPTANRAGLPAALTSELPATDALDHLETLRLAAARSAQADRYARLDELVTGALALIRDRLALHALQADVTLDASLDGVMLEKGVLRQVLLGLLGYLVERASDAAIRLTGSSDGQLVRLSLSVEPPSAVHPTSALEVAERLAAFSEMASMAGARLRSSSGPQVDDAYAAVAGFEITLPVNAQQIILVVDDNEDVLELFRRILQPHHYRVVTARSVPEAVELAAGLQPFAITIDLMLPGQDGWDLLQLLLNRPDTRQIPIIVCSVLKQKELALSLGATAFLEKPVTEQAINSALAALAAS